MKFGPGPGPGLGEGGSEAAEIASFSSFSSFNFWAVFNFRCIELFNEFVEEEGGCCGGRGGCGGLQSLARFLPMEVEVEVSTMEAGVEREAEAEAEAEVRPLKESRLRFTTSSNDERSFLWYSR